MIYRSLVESITDRVYRQLLTEDQAGKSINQAVDWLMGKMEKEEEDTGRSFTRDRIGGSREDADKFVRNQVRTVFPALREKGAGKFTLGATRMYFDDFVRTGIEAINLDAALRYAARKGVIEKFDKNLNGLSYEKFYGLFKDEIERDKRESLKSIDKNEYRGAKYNVVRIDDFEEAKKYYKWSYWCIAGNKVFFDAYTHNGGTKFFFLLRDGFEDIPAEVGEDVPLDEYGLSMLAVNIDRNHNLISCTCRWNHTNGGSENVLNPSGIYEYTGVDIRKLNF